MSTPVQLLYEEAIAKLVARGVELEPTRMFGSNGVKTAGKTFAMIVRGSLVVKLPAARVEQLVTDGLGTRFDPGHGRLMKEWAALRPANLELTVAYMREASAFVDASEDKAGHA